MPVHTQNQLYKDNLPDWTICRDCIKGDRAIKAKGTAYVPKLSDQSDLEYKAYINRPFFENYTQRVLDGMTGLIFLKNPKINLPTTLENYRDNFDLKGATIIDYAQELTDEVVSVDRVGALVDMGRDEGSKRPYATIYNTESIINWKHENINNQNTLVMVVLREFEDSWIDEFESEKKEIFRVLKLIEGQYVQEIHRVRDAKEVIYDIETIVPLMNGKPLTYIPFVSITKDKLSIIPTKPPLLDLALVNISHFKLNVDYYHGVHFTALPTPYGSGIQSSELKNQDFKIGSTSFTWFTQPQAKLSYLEFEGKGLETLENEKSKLIASMVILGSNMLQGDKNVAEAENTVAMRNAGQNASITSIADTVSRGMVRILQIMTEWAGANGQIEFELNTDYNNTEISPQLIKELIAGKALNEIPRKVLFEVFRKGEIIPDDMTLEEYETLLAEEAPIVQTSALPSKANNDIDLEAIRKSVGAD